MLILYSLLVNSYNHLVGKQVVKKVGDCQNYGGPWFEVGFKDGHGGYLALERHCNQCKRSIDAETGEVRNEGRSDLINIRAHTSETKG